MSNEMETITKIVGVGEKNGRASTNRRESQSHEMTVGKTASLECYFSI